MHIEKKQIFGIIGALIIIAIVLLFSMKIVAASLSTITDPLEFFTSGTNDNPMCANTGDYAENPLWSIGGVSSYSLHDCHREGIADCCQTQGLTLCQQNESLQFNCVEGPQSCGELTQEQCGDESFKGLSYDELNSIGISCYAETSVGEHCYQRSDCRCVWNEGSCKPETSEIIFNNNGNEVTGTADEIQAACDMTIEPIFGECIFNTSIINNCNSTGLKFMSWTVDWTGALTDSAGAAIRPDYCKDDSKNVRCIANELSFFTTIGIIFLIVLIVIFYIYVFRKKKTAGKRKRKR